MIRQALLARARLAQLVATNFGTVRGLVRHQLAQLEWSTGRLDKFVSIRPQNVRRLVFVCLGNINRSAFAEFVARAQGVRVCSLGLATTTGAPAFAMAVETARRFGLDLRQHAATDIGDYRYEPGDLLLAMEVRHVRRLQSKGIPAEAIALLGAWTTPQRIHLHDPHTLSSSYFRTCFTLIHVAVINLVNELRAADSPCIER